MIAWGLTDQPVRRQWLRPECDETRIQFVLLRLDELMDEK